MVYWTVNCQVSLVVSLSWTALVAGNGSYILRPCDHDLHGPTVSTLYLGSLNCDINLCFMWICKLEFHWNGYWSTWCYGSIQKIWHRWDSFQSHGDRHSGIFYECLYSRYISILVQFSASKQNTIISCISLFHSPIQIYAPNEYRRICNWS